MRIPTIIVSLAAAICFMGCSKEGGSSGKSKGLVPKTAAEVMNSPDFKLEHTTKSGIQCYIRYLTPEMVRSIPENSRDHAFLADDEKKPYLFVPVHRGKVVDLTADDNGLSLAEGLEIAAFGMKKSISEDPEMQKLIKEAGKK
jgi:hypothetical protein